VLTHGHIFTSEAIFKWFHHNDMSNTEYYSVNALSEKLNTDRRTLKKHLAEIEPAAHENDSPLYRIEDAKLVMKAAQEGQGGLAELRRQRIREAKARAKLLEFEVKQKTGELVSMAEVQALFTAALLPVRQRLLAMPAECCTSANPTDPQHARAALQTWVDTALPMIREQLPQPKPE
jgi:hypothetical protein